MSRVEPKPPSEQSRQFTPKRPQAPAGEERHPSKAEGEEGDVEKVVEGERERR